MRALIQRVKNASVDIKGKTTASIKIGLVVLLGIEEADSFQDIEWLASKISKLRIFNDEAGVMNKSIIDIDGEIIVVSQFTLHASTKKGNRPSYIKAATAAIAIPLYEQFIVQLQKEIGKEIGRGEFGADMQIALINDGPVTISIDTKNKE
jgi:D-tyrosyl-tRNA(Tyr) deacylase